MCAKPAPDPLYVLRGPRSPVTSLRFQGASTEFLYSGCADGVVYIWDQKIRRVASQMQAHPDHSILWMEFCDGDTFMTQGRDGHIKIWSQLETGWIESGVLKTSSLGFCGSAVLDISASTCVAVPSEDQSQCDLYDLKTRSIMGKLKPDLQTKDDTRYGMCMVIRGVKQPDHPGVVIGYEDGSVALWDVRTFKIIDKLKIHPESVMAMDFSSVSMKGFSGSVDSSIFSWTVSEDSQMKIETSLEVTNPGFNDIKVRSDDKIVATAGWDSRIRVFGTKKLKPLAVLHFHKESVQCLTFSSDNILAAGSKDCLISLWDIYK